MQSTRYIELEIPEYYLTAPFGRGQNEAEILERLEDLNRQAQRATLLGQSAIEAPTRWLEEALELVAPFVRPTQGALEVMTRWNQHRVDIFGLQVIYGSVPNLLDKAGSFLARVGEVSESGSEQDEELETVEACVLAQQILNDHPEQAALVYTEDEPVGSAATKSVVVTEARIEEVNQDNLVDLKELGGRVAAAVQQRKDTVVVAPETITVLHSLNKLLIGWDGVYELEAQVQELEEGMVIWENKLEDDIDVLRDAARLLKQFLKTSQIFKQTGIDIATFEEWYTRVLLLKTPQELRGAERDKTA